MVWLQPVATAGRVVAAASSGNDLLGGTDLLRLLVLAVGGALVVGNVLALLRPPSRLPAGERQAPPLRPPLARSVVMITIGSVAVIWALASLTS
ncbi:MAG: hypothetical protein M3083_03225 [Actinomycetota bacterium]|nr:hypothetical protein [Actinomycetota bacterium]